MNYQSKRSNPQKKWEDLKLKESDYTDKDILDLGCNEGWFCNKVATLAKSVIGVDKDINVIPQGQHYHCCDWDKFLEQTHLKFDLIFWLSALHYCKEPEYTFELIHQVLKPDGLLVLETGVVDSNDWCYQVVYRSDHSVRYPSNLLLYNRFLHKFTKRHVGISGIHDGIERSVLHCRMKQPTAFLVGGPSETGKTNVSGLFDCDVCNLDKHLISMLKYNGERLPYLHKTLKEIEIDHSEEYVKSILSSISTNDIVFEGVVVNFKNMRKLLIDGLIEKGFRIWEVEKNG